MRQLEDILDWRENHQGVRKDDMTEQQAPPATMDQGGPAFPLLDDFGSGLGLRHPGMFLRDYFAAAACTGILLAKNKDALQVHIESVAVASYAVADALLKARSA